MSPRPSLRELSSVSVGGANSSSGGSSPIITGLQKALNFTYALASFTQNLHWNMVGDQFLLLHPILGDQYSGLFDDADTIAERIRQLDTFVVVDLAKFQSDSGIAVLKAPFDTKTQIKQLVEYHQKNIETLKALEKQCSEDLETQNLLVDLVTKGQKTVWMLKSYLR